MKLNIIVSDPPWNFSDKLKHSKVKRGAESNYKVLSDTDIINLPMVDVAADDSILFLWCPASKIDVGLECVKSYGFAHKQIWTWVKTKNEPLDFFKKAIKKCLKQPEVCYDKFAYTRIVNSIADSVVNVNLNDTLAFGMGKIARNCCEYILVGTRGKILKHLKNKSERNVFFAPLQKNVEGKKHSVKPEILQNRIDKMFPDQFLLKGEFFARRDRPGYICCGLECPGNNEDIIISLNNLVKK